MSRMFLPASELESQELQRRLALPVGPLIKGSPFAKRIIFPMPPMDEMPRMMLFKKMVHTSMM